MRRRYYIKLLAIILILAIVPVVVISSLHYVLATHSMEKEVRHTNQVMLDNIKNVIDTKMMSIRRDFMAFLLTDGSLDRLRQGSMTPADISSLVADLNMFKTKYDYVADVFVYDMRGRSVLTPDGSYDPDYFFSDLQLGSMDPYFELPHYFQFYNIPRFYSNSRQYAATAVVSTMPLRSMSYDTVVSLVLDHGKIMNDINKMHGENRGFVIVRNEENQVIFTSSGGPTPIETMDLFSALGNLNEGDASTFLWNDEKYIAVHADSGFMNYRYTSYIPYSVITSNFQFIQLISLTIMGAFVLIGLLVSLYSSKRLYRPIGKLIANFAADGGQGAAGNEFSFLDAKIQHMLSENKELQLELMESAKVLQLDFLRKLLHGEIEKEQVKELVEKFRLQLSHKYNVVLVFQGAAAKEALVRERLDHSWSHYYGLEVEKRYIVLLNLNKKDNLAKVVALFEDLPVCIASGEPVEQAAELDVSYRQARACLQYRSLAPKFEHIAYADLERLRRKYASLLVPAEWERKLAVCLDSGRLDQASACFQEYLHRYIEDDVPLRYVRQNAEQLAATIRRLCRQFQWKTEEALPTPYTFDESGGLDGVVDGLRRTMDDFLAFAARRAPKEDRLLDEILAYLNKHYMKDISLYTLADEFNVSYHHLSKQFKQHTGLMYSEYISNLRIEKAKALMQEDRLKVKEIAERVGYNNSVSFNRNFKKIVGIAPGQYLEWVARKES